ncbi:MAG: phytanoyl-CoA dioxygenase family protein [Erythrobacter sp.]|uniref:phytanoyl-CoA dioxygenase family protein n=1 Tax=Erythrobacter sp. TaxID=1042 RepID=UPI00261368B1|nr:phytanoyl-CoA dioxygenase family protein [Erythrobacter sp.]MDJ0977307.1 phytanoyl-CoA dioxygenase family protein [Erythrobacter sp.]
MSVRHSREHVEAWTQEGGVLIDRFFTPDEVAAVRADFEAVFGTKSKSETAATSTKGDKIGTFDLAQFTGLQPIPFDCSPALNLIGVHPALINLAKDFLRTDAVHLYQCQAWAKFTGDADYDQPFHCDFVNHTLTVPSEQAHMKCVTIICYFTDVTEAHGPTHYVPKSRAAPIAAPEDTLSLGSSDQAEMQSALKEVAASAASPAGSILPYSIDVYHRGTNMTAPDGCRYAVMACFKRAGDENIAFHAWANDIQKPWNKIFDHASPEQLACFGVPLPGHAFWSETTLKRAQLRYPGWNLTPYRDALVSEQTPA